MHTFNYLQDCRNYVRISPQSCQLASSYWTTLTNFTYIRWLSWKFHSLIFSWAITAVSSTISFIFYFVKLKSVLRSLPEWGKCLCRMRICIILHTKTDWHEHVTVFTSICDSLCVSICLCPESARLIMGTYSLHRNKNGDFNVPNWKPTVKW